MEQEYNGGNKASKTTTQYGNIIYKFLFFKISYCFLYNIELLFFQTLVYKQNGYKKSN